MNSISQTGQAYRHCRAIASAHYENFPVASLLLPRWMRDPVAAIYAFARRADDLADEGEVSAEQRLSAIDAQQHGLLEAVAARTHSDPILLATADACHRHRLPVELLLDLLSAFRQDVGQARYADDAELLDYCRRSANPIGRLLLHLTGRAQQPALRESDALCSALQLLNFLQDINADYHERGRLYLPEQALAACSLPTAADLFAACHAEAVRALMDSRILMIRDLLQRSQTLAGRLPGRLALEIRLTWVAADELCRRLHNRGANLTDRCHLSAGAKLRLLARSLLG